MKCYRLAVSRAQINVLILFPAPQGIKPAKGGRLRQDQQMLSLPVIAFALGLGSYVWADQTLQENTRNTILYDGLIPLNFTVSDLDNSDSPYVYVIRYIVP
jgi:hypothetical protein